MADIIEGNPLYRDNSKPVFSPTGPNDAVANWEGFLGVPFAGQKAPTTTISERATAARSAESALLVPQVVQNVIVMPPLELMGAPKPIVLVAAEPVVEPIVEPTVDVVVEPTPDEGTP
jgi:hypothetical protein